MVGCTVVATNYLPYARVVAAGWRRAHPETAFHVLLLDGGATEARKDDFTTVLPEELGLPDAELQKLRGMYGVAELNSALKPLFIGHLLKRGADAVVYLDSDTDVHGPVEDVAHLAIEHGVAITPNVLLPLPLDGLSPSEFDLDRVGIYNSGSIAVGPRGRPFLEWWASRVQRDCLFSEDEGLHADQRCLNWVPVYFGHAVQRDPTLNVAHWNLHERRLGSSRGRFTVDGRPLPTFHFAGFDPERPERVTKYQWEARVRGLLEPNPAVDELCREYAAKLMAAGYREAVKAPYRFGRSVAGTALGRRERAVYRELVLAAEQCGQDIPDPFDPARSDAFERMLASPRDTGLLSPGALERTGHSWDGERRPWRMVIARRRRREVPRPRAGDRTRREYLDGLPVVGAESTPGPSQASA